MSIVKNVFEAITRFGHDEDFVPQETNDFTPTQHLPGSQAKIDVLRKRVDLGQPLWHGSDRINYAGETGAVAISMASVLGTKAE